MESLGIAMDNLAYFALGLGCGLLTSFIFGQLFGQAKAVTHSRMEDIMQKPRETFGHASVTRSVVILVVSLILFGLGVQVGFKVLNEKVQCFDNYANELADSLQPRQDAVETYQVRQDAVFDSTERLLNGDESARDDLTKALEEYRLARTQLAQERRENPYPDAPREVCR